MSNALLVVGSVNADLYIQVERLPTRGENITGEVAPVRPGGKGANQAAAAARLGQETWFAGRLGSDSYAMPLREALSATGVKLGLLDGCAGPSGQAFILLQPGGENAIIVAAGANRSWGELGRALEGRIRESGAILLQREIPDQVNLQVATIAAAAGVPVILDAGGSDLPVPVDLLPLLTVFSPNESELARLSGMPTGSRDEVIAAARRLQDQGLGTVLVKIDKRGALLVPKGGEVAVREAFDVEVVDSTGAGDCFTAAFTVGLLEHRPQAECLRLAAAAAALSVQKLGAMPSMPTRREVDAFLRANP